MSVNKGKTNEDDFERNTSREEINLNVEILPDNSDEDELQILGKETDSGLKKIAREVFQIYNPPPKDTYYIVYLICVLQGIGAAIGFNVLMISKQYYVNYKLSPHYTHEDTTRFTTNFLPYVGLASWIPLVIFNWINIFIVFRGHSPVCIICSISVEIAVYLVTIILALLDTSSWPETFFWITIFNCIIFHMANGMHQNTIFGITAILPHHYISGVVLGTIICGIFVTLLQLLTLLISPDNYKLSGIIIFSTTVLVFVACIVTFLLLPKFEFYSYYKLKCEANCKAREIIGTVVSKFSVLQSCLPEISNTVPYWQIFKSSSLQCFNVAYTYTLTFCLFPAVYSDIKRSDSEFIISENFFITVMCFLTFGIFAFLGTIVSHFVELVGPERLLILVLLRTIFIPTFFVSNYQPQNIQRTMPVLIANDWIFWMLAIAFSFSHGYIANLAVSYVPGMVKSQYRSIAGQYGGASMVTGICCGILISSIFPFLI